ncbi:unannotated protein [freshwater metagenome]|uniref:Unannotated protein n=1 Tax=freshwater metagenome TaxID=449393 RepID=A0A6J7J0E6_9ZZZZ|nr:hypothetical protein [Actinomycetota bacterium]
MNSSASPLHIAVYGHESASPSAVALAFGGHCPTVIDPASDCAIFAVNPAMGIDQQTIELWQAFDEFQIPRIVVVTHIENLEADFDDAITLANRVFDQMATPYLVLHDEAGLPCALIELATMRIIDYSTTPPGDLACEPEHETLVQEFRDEYLELVSSMGEGAFAAGLLFPAIPLWIEKSIGVDVVVKYLNQLSR